MPCGALGMPPHQGVVAPSGAVWAANWAISDARRRLGAGDDEQPRTAGVEAVDDARALRASPTPAMSGKRASRPLTSVPSAIAGAGMDDEPGRLVDDDDVVVGVDDGELDGRRRRAGGVDTGIAAVSIVTRAPVREADLAGRRRPSPSTRTAPAAISAADATG